MGVADHRFELLTAAAALRRARLRAPEDADLLTAERVVLEQLRPTVSQRAAARFLGVTQPALGRWVDRGVLATVVTPSGAHQIPVAALLRLGEAIERERERGVGHPLEAIARRDAAHAAQIAVSRSTEREEHVRALARARVYHQALAARLGDNEVRAARATLARWEHDGRIGSRYADAWRKLLDRPTDDLRRAITADDPFTDDLRQNSPFAGLLSETERRRIIELVV